MAFFAYILGNLEGRFYIGQTSDLELRLQRHNEGRVFWTKSRGPWSLVYAEEFPSRSEAIAREKELKALKSKEELRKLMAQW